MPTSIVMPALEMAQETGKLVSWRKKEGDAVVKGETLLEVETDKAVMEIEAPANGTLTGVKAEEGADIPVGQIIAWIVGPGEVPPPEGPPRSSARPQTGAAHPVSASHNLGQPDALGGRVSPKARRLARERGIDVSSLRGSGPEGAVIAADIEQGTPALRKGVNVPLSTVGRLMAERTALSWTTVPHFFVTRDLDATGLLRARETRAASIQQSHGIKLSYTDLLVAAVAQALTQNSHINGSWSGGGIRLNPHVNVAIAIAVEDGVVATVIPNTDKASLGEIASQRKALTDRARAGRLRPNDVGGGTFTITNLGMFEVDSFQAIITPPQAAILAIGRIAERIVVSNGRSEIRNQFSATLSCDHRVVDGAKAAIFLKTLAATLDDLPQLLP